MRHEQQLDELVAEQAVRWFTRIDNFELGDVEREEFHRWLLADPEHEKAFMAIGCIAAVAAESPKDARLQSLSPKIAATPESGRRRFLRSGAIAASVLLALVAGTFFVDSRDWIGESYFTQTGEMRTVKFEDGSVAYLNTRTHLKWLGGLNERRVALLDGEALFDVVHDESRPFHVQLENSEIQVRGTRFNVYCKKSGEVVVTVLEGTVDVQELGQGNGRPAWKRELHASERIVYRPIGLIRDVHPTDALNAVKWRDGVLHLDKEPLEEVLDELTRYTDRRIVLRDPRIAKILIGGALSTRDVRTALDSIAILEPSIQVKETGDQFELSLRPPSQLP